MKIRTKVLRLPIIQGGMGVGVSLSGLAGHVASCGAMGTISSVNAGYADGEFLTNPVKANLKALAGEIHKAKEIAGGNGLVAVNIMTAVSHYEETCRCAVEAGADAIISGAGLPLTLPEYTRGSDTLCAPIVSSGRAARLLIRHYRKHYDCLPDFLVIEGSRAGGHLGFSAEELEDHTAKTNEEILRDVLAAAPDYSRTVNIPRYGWMAVLFAALSFLVYVCALCFARTCRRSVLRRICALRSRRIWQSCRSASPKASAAVSCARSFMRVPAPPRPILRISFPISAAPWLPRSDFWCCSLSLTGGWDCLASFRCFSALRSCPP